MRRNSNGIIIVIVLIVIFIAFSTIAGSDEKLVRPPYTVFNSEQEGVSLIYDTLKLMNPSVKVSYHEINWDSSIYDAQAIVVPDEQYLGYEELDSIFDWVFDGGKLIYFDDYQNDSWLIDEYLYDLEFAEMNNFYLYSYGLGVIVVGDSNSIVNGNLLHDSGGGQLIQGTLHNWNVENIYFNEYYHGFQKESSLYKELPVGLKIIFYQLILIVVLIIWFMGKRFGKSVPYFEEIEREETEYLKTLSNIYERAGMGKIIIENYYSHLIKKSADYFDLSHEKTEENITALWKAKGLPEYNTLIATVEAMKTIGSLKTKSTADKKVFVKIIKNLEKLIRSVEHAGRSRFHQGSDR